MQMIQSHRDFVAGVSAVGVAAAFGPRHSLADEGPPEVTTIRIRVEDAPPLPSRPTRDARHLEGH